MPRSSRHKSSSKHGSSRDYSDSEKDSGFKDRKGGGGKEEAGSRVSKEVGGSSEKRKFVDLKEGKEPYPGNGECLEEYSSSSKRRRDRAEESGDDRWNGGGDGEEDRGDGGRKPGKDKEKAELRSKRREEGVGGESEEVVKKVSSGKSEGKHRDSGSRKEVRDGGADRDRDREKEREREKKGRSEKFVDVDESRFGKLFSEKNDVSTNDLMVNPESENQLDRRTRKKRDFSDTDKPIDIVGDINDRLSSKEEAAKDGRTKDDKYRDKYRDEVDRENRHRDVRDERAARDHSNNRSDNRHIKDEKEAAETRQKKTKPQDAERDHDREYDRNRDYIRDQDRDYERERDRDQDHDRNRERGREKERGRDHLYDRDWDQDRDHDEDRDWDWDRDHDRERYLDRDRDRDQDGEIERDRGRDRFSESDSAFADDRSTRSKENRGRKRTPDEYDDYSGSKYRGGRTTFHDMGKRSASAGRGELDGDRGRPLLIQAPVDNTANSDKRRTSPSTNSHGTQEEYRHVRPEESRYRDAVSEERTKTNSSREAANILGSSDRASKYRSAEKPVKMDDGHFRELSQERPAGSKASPMGLTDRSPSLSLDRGRYSNRSVARRSLEIEELGRRGHSSSGPRDFPSGDDRTNRDLPLDKPLADDVTLMDSPFHNRVSQSHPALAPPAFRGGIGSPSFMGSVEEDGRPGSGARHKRSIDHPRGQGNPWRGPPNWPSPMPNGFMPFQHGPPHGGFPPMMPQFPSLFGVRPSIDINHSGMPYHIPDADRFSGHFRPLGWQNMMDGSGPSHVHGWDGNNGLFRDDVLFGGPDWDPKRNHMNGRGWEPSTEFWKGQNGDVNMEMPTASTKEDFPVQPLVEDALKSGQASRSLQNDLTENNQLTGEPKDIANKLAVSPATRESDELSPKTAFEMAPDPPKMSSDNDATHFCHAYLSKLDISMELASPKLYNQCMSLISMDLTDAVDEDSVLLVNLKDGAMAVPKGTVALLGTSLFPASSDSVYQQALDLYKKQRVGSILLRSPEGVTGEIISATKVEEQVSVKYVEGPDRPVVEYDVGMAEVPESDLDQNKVSSPGNKEKAEEMISASSYEGNGQGHAPCVKMELSDQSFSHDVTKNPIETVTGTDMEGMKPVPLYKDDAEGHGDANPGNMFDSAATSGADTRLDEKVEVGNNFSACAEEGQDPLVIADGPCIASGELMPKFSESESVILSRIHHSPEITH